MIFNRWDRGLKGELSLQDFLRFYAAAAKEREGLVWDHLKALGYDETLTRYGTTLKIASPSMLTPSSTKFKPGPVAQESTFSMGPNAEIIREVREAIVRDQA